jgi:type I restriction enzyme S subunit
MSKQKGSAIPFIRSNQIMDLIIPIPKLEIQNKIVEILDLYYNIIENNNKNIKNYEETKKNIVYAYTIYTEKQKLGNIFKKVKIGQDIVTNKRKKGIYPYYGANGIIDKIDNYIFNGKFLLTARTGSIGSLHITNNYFWCSGDVHCIEFDNEITLTYMYYYLHIVDFQKYRTGSVYPKLSTNNLKSILVALPSLEIQNKIVQECEYYDNMINILKSENEKLQNNNIIEMFLNNHQLIEFDNDNILLNNNHELEQESEQESEYESEQELEQEHINVTI